MSIHINSGRYTAVTGMDWLRIASGGASETTLLLDTFTGALANVNTHAPDINLSGNAWSSLYGTINLTGSGRATSTDALWTNKYALDVAQSDIEAFAKINLGQVADTFRGPGILFRPTATTAAAGMMLVLVKGQNYVAVEQWSGGADQDVDMPAGGYTPTTVTLDDNTDFWLRLGLYDRTFHIWIGAGSPSDPSDVAWEWLQVQDGYQFNNWTTRAFPECNLNSTATRIGIGTAFPSYAQPTFDYLKVVQPASVKSLLWLGDSLISNTGSDVTTARPYSRTVSAAYNNGHVSVANMAFPGSGVTSPDIYSKRLRDQIAAAPSLAFNKIIIGSGVNDTDYAATWTTEANYCIGQLQSLFPSVPIYWCGLWPGQNSGADVARNPMISALSGITYINPSTSGIIAGDYADGIHLKPSGNDKAKVVVLSAIG